MKKHLAVRKIIAVFLCLTLLYGNLFFSAPLTALAATPKEAERALDVYHGILSIDPEQFRSSEESLIVTCGGTEEKYRYMKELALEITKNCGNDREKIYAVVEYVARNVYYDYDHYEDRVDWTNSGAYYVLTEGFSVCTGYNQAVCALLELLRIPCASIASHDHVYSMAFDGDRWVLTDATWVSCNRKEYGEFYHSDSINTAWLDFSLDQAINNYNHIPINGELLIYDGCVINYPSADGSDMILPSTATEIGWDKADRINTFYLPRSVKTIQEGAFADITISSILYEGSQEEFAVINIGEGNENLLNASISYLDCASVPSITRHPLDQTTSIGTEVTLTTAAAPVEGIVSYQWYRSTSRATTGGTAISGADQATYTFTPTDAGTHYYYAVVTNQNSKVSGNPVSTDTTVAAQIEVLDRVPTGQTRLGPNAVCYQFSDPNETRFVGSDPLLEGSISRLINLGTVSISADFTGIEEHLDSLRDCYGFRVDPAHPVYSSDSSGTLFNKDTNTLLCLPRYSSNSHPTSNYSIPDSITTIADDAFAYYYLSRLHIPAQITDIQGALGELESLWEITADSSNPRFTILDEALIDTVGNRLITLPRYLRTYTVPEGIRKIEDKSFYKSNITNISFPDSLRGIGDEAFWDCRFLYGIPSLPSGLIRIGNYAFYDCENATGSLILPDTLAEIGKFAFAYCRGLSGTLVIPNSVTSLGDACFIGCKKIETVTLPAGLETLPTNSFNSCSALTAITLPRGLLHMESGCLSDTGLTEITIPATVNFIAPDAFSNHKSITVYGCTGSYAETYAKAHNMPFVNIGISATSVKVKNTAAEMIVGTTWKPEFSLLPSGTTDAVTLTSSDPSIVSVQSGCKLSALRPGQVTIQAETTGGASCSFSVTIHNASRLQITVPPAQIDYECSEVLDLSGIQVEAVLRSGKTLAVTDFTVSDFESRNPGKKEITVSVGDLSDTFSVYAGATQGGNWTNTCQWSCSPSGALTVTGTLPANTKLLAATYHSSGKLVEASILPLDQKWQPSKDADYAQLYLLQEDLAPDTESIRVPLPFR